MRALVATCEMEGGYYTPDKDKSRPIRIYSDRWVEDDFVVSILGRVKRNRLSKKEYRRIRNAAKQNRNIGVV